MNTLFFCLVVCLFAFVVSQDIRAPDPNPIQDVFKTLCDKVNNARALIPGNQVSVHIKAAQEIVDPEPNQIQVAVDSLCSTSSLNPKNKCLFIFLHLLGLNATIETKRYEMGIIQWIHLH